MILRLLNGFVSLGFVLIVMLGFHGLTDIQIMIGVLGLQGIVLCLIAEAILRGQAGGREKRTAAPPKLHPADFTRKDFWGPVPADKE